MHVALVVINVYSLCMGGGGIVVGPHQIRELDIGSHKLFIGLVLAMAPCN